MNLSIVTITRDDPEGVTLTLASASRLRARPDVEQVVIDSSGAELAARVERMARAQGAKYHWCEPMGIAAAFNRGVELARGEWVWFLNGGDAVDPDLKEEMLFTLLECSTAEAAIFKVRMPGGVDLERPALNALWPPLFNWIPHPATIVRRQAICRVGGFSTDFRIAVDGEFWIRLFGNSARSDIIPLTISSFAAGGVSGDTRALAVEVKKVISQHKGLLLRRWLRQGYMMLIAWNEFRKRSQLR